MKKMFDAFLDRAIELLCISATCGLLWLLVDWLVR
jgi:hypothetical protein